MANQFAQDVAYLRQSLFDKQILNGHFLELKRHVANIQSRLEEICVAYFKLAVKFTDLMMPHFFGAARVTHQIDCMRHNVKDGNFEACKIVFEHIKRESEVLQLKLENYLEVKNQGPPTEIEDQSDYGAMNSDSE